MRLFRWVARETAAALGYAYSTEGEEQVAALVAAVLDRVDQGVSWLR